MDAETGSYVRFIRSCIEQSDAASHVTSASPIDLCLELLSRPDYSRVLPHRHCISMLSSDISDTLVSRVDVDERLAKRRSFLSESVTDQRETSL